jgi:hypothetical protein
MQARLEAVAIKRSLFVRHPGSPYTANNVGAMTGRRTDGFRDEISNRGTRG